MQSLSRLTTQTVATDRAPEPRVAESCPSKRRLQDPPLRASRPNESQELPEAPDCRAAELGDAASRRGGKHRAHPIRSHRYVVDETNGPGSEQTPVYHRQPKRFPLPPRPLGRDKGHRVLRRA